MTVALRPIDRVLDALSYRGTREGKTIMCQCPAHDDHTSSLSVSAGDDGRVLLNCFAGCEPERVVAALGLKMVDLFVEPLTKSKPRAKKSGKLGPIVAEYDYRDATGKLLYQATRHDPKDFRQRRPDGRGGYVWDMQGVELVPYRLPELIRTPSSQMVFVVEGEKDVDNLRTRELAATCNVQGAGKWRTSYNVHFQERNVCILPDNDEPGRKHAQDVARNLQGIAARVKVLELPGLPIKGDVSDWLAAGGDADKLLTLVEDTPDYIAPVPTAPTAHSNGNGTHATAAASIEPPSTAHRRDLAKLNYSLALNMLDDVIEVNGNRLDDGLAAVIRMQMRDMGHKNMGAVEDTYTAMAYENRYHPVRRYLDSLQWDGSDQIKLLCTHVRDKHDPIVYRNRDGKVISTVPLFRVWLYRWSIAAVARVYQPRVQNHVLTLSGGQGLGKSRLASFLGSGLPDMFIESPIHPDNVDHNRYLATKWIWEIAELGATTRRADREALKAFITKGDVTFRKPYGKHPISKPALANFIGTINDEAGFLTDPTGNRRFLIVTLESINWDYEKVVDVHQLWAQIVADFRQGERWELLPVEQAVRDGMNRDYERIDPIEERIIQNFDIDSAKSEWFMFTTEIADHLRAVGAKDADQSLYNGVGNAMRRLQLQSGQRMVDGQRGRGYYGIRKKSELHTLHTHYTPE